MGERAEPDGLLGSLKVFDSLTQIVVFTRVEGWGPTESWRISVLQDLCDSSRVYASLVIGLKIHSSK